MYKGKSHTLFAKYAVPQMIGLLFNSVYTIVDSVSMAVAMGLLHHTGKYFIHQLAELLGAT